MIDPKNIINHNRTDAELEELLMFLVVVAGKKASTMAVLLEEFLQRDSQYLNKLTPFRKISWMLKHGVLMDYVKLSGFGQYNRVTRAFREMANSGLDLKTCTLQDLLKIYGIGRKSASCFLMWRRPNQRVSGLDVHLLKHMKALQDSLERAEAYLPSDSNLRAILEPLRGIQIPKSTPGSKRIYDTLENVFLAVADYNGKTPEAYDLAIWVGYVDGGKGITT